MMRALPMDSFKFYKDFKFTFSLFSPIIALGFVRDTTYGIRAKVGTLGPNWAQKFSYVFYFGTRCLLNLELCRGGWNISSKSQRKWPNTVSVSM